MYRVMTLKEKITQMCSFAREIRGSRIATK